MLTRLLRWLGLVPASQYEEALSMLSRAARDRDRWRRDHAEVCAAHRRLFKDYERVLVDNSRLRAAATMAGRN